MREVDGYAYQERAAPRSGGVMWRRRSSGAGPARILPDGCLDLIWSSRAGLFVAGPDSVAHLSAPVAEERLVGLRLPPGVGPAVLGVAAHELTDSRVPLSSVWPASVVRDLGARLATASAPGTLLDAVAETWLARRGGPDRVAAPVARLLAAGASVATVAAEVGLSERQLHRRARDLYGYGPKTLARILRLRRALALVDRGWPAVRAAVDAGYADQPHLAREVRALAGVPLGELRPTT
jgi:AraC-like DNA-binding protein